MEPSDGEVISQRRSSDKRRRLRINCSDWRKFLSRGVRIEYFFFSSDILFSAPKRPPIASIVMINETEYDVTGCRSLKALTEAEVKEKVDR